MNNWIKDKMFMPDIMDKDWLFSTYIRYMYDRTSRIFKYDGLPETIPQRELELILQTFGHGAVFHHNGNLWIANGNWSDVPNAYYIPTKYIIANPVLGSHNLVIGDECVVMGNDTMYTGLHQLHSKYAMQLVENDISMMMALYNSRIQQIISAQDDRTVASAKLFIDKIKKGDLSVVVEDEYYEGIKTSPFSTVNSHLQELLENRQYLKSCWFNEIGLNANYNMKRESINTSEAQMNNDALYPLIDDMLECRKQKVEEINNLFGTNITVELTGVWAVKDEEMIEEQKDEIPDVDEEEQTSDTSADEKDGEEDENNK